MPEPTFSLSSVPLEDVNEVEVEKLPQLAESDSKQQAEKLCSFEQQHTHVQLRSLYQQQLLCDLALWALDDSSCHDVNHSCMSRTEPAGGYEVGFKNTERAVQVPMFRELRCHKSVISAHSDYFAAMFNAKMREFSQSKVTFNHICFNNLKIIVDYAYTGFVEVNEKSVFDVIVDSNFLQVTSLTTICSDFIRQSLLTVESCIEVLLFATNNNLCLLSQYAMDYTRDHFVSVWNQCQHSFNAYLSHEIITELLSSDQLNVQTELQVFQAVLGWLDYNWTDRRTLAYNVLQTIRMVHLPTQILATDLLQNSVIQLDANSCHLVQKASTQQSALTDVPMPPYIADQISTTFYPRPSTLGDIFVIGGLGGTMDSNAITDCQLERFNARQRTWSSYESAAFAMTAGRSQFRTVVGRRNEIVVIGGRKGMKTLKDVDCFTMTSHCENETIDETINDSWLHCKLPSMKICRQGMSACIAEENLSGINTSVVFAIGGYDGWNYLNSVEKLCGLGSQSIADTSMKEWTQVPSMKAARSNCSSVVIANRVYVIGGRDGSSVLSSMEMFDLTTYKWSYCASMNTRRFQTTAVAFSSYIFVCGGAMDVGLCKILDSCERYDTTQNAWTSIKPLLSPRCKMDSVLFGFHIYIIGGCNRHSKSTKLCETYDIFTDTWAEECELTVERVNPCAIVLRRLN